VNGCSSVPEGPEGTVKFLLGYPDVETSMNWCGVQKAESWSDVAGKEICGGPARV
jgi:hypothetical protein